VIDEVRRQVVGLERSKMTRSLLTRRADKLLPVSDF